MTRADAIRELAQRYTDLYCREGGIHKRVADLLFEELATWLDDGAPEGQPRGFKRGPLARRVGRTEDLSGLDKVVRVIAQNLQIFGHRTVELPTHVKRTSWKLEPDPSEIGLAPIESLLTFNIDGEAKRIHLDGPSAAARGDHDKGRYWFAVQFRDTVAASELLRALLANEHLNESELQRVADALQHASLAERATCAELLRPVEAERDKLRGELPEVLGFQEHERALGHDGLVRAFDALLNRERTREERLTRVLEALQHLAVP